MQSLRRTLTLTVCFVLGVVLCFSASAAASLIGAENQAAGDPAWSQTAEGDVGISGYAWPLSARPGETIELHVSTAGGARYRVEIYRVGFYGGVGGRRLACLPDCATDEVGSERSTAAPDGNGQAIADWPVSDRIAINPAWVSGYYLARLILTSGARVGQASAVPFVVRSPAATSSAVLVQVPVNTWQAYNPWGGKSLYPLNSSGGAPANRVSFLRPLSLAAGTAVRIEQSPTWSEYPLVRFLESRGYDVSYQTDQDSDREPGSLLAHQLVISAGHDEYWTASMRDAFEAARDRGVNLAFMGSNASYWQVRYENYQTAMVGYKDLPDPNPDPAQRTVRWRALGRPECRLVGVLYHANDVSAGGDYTVTPTGAKDPWLAGTGLSPGSALPGLVRTEWDSLQRGCRPEAKALFHFHGHPHADASRYQASSGARVFASGSLGFAAGLDPTGGLPALRAFMANALADLSRPAPPRGLTVRRNARGIQIIIRRWRPGLVLVYRQQGSRRHLLCRTTSARCSDRARQGRIRYSAVSEGSFGASAALTAKRG